MNLSFNKKPIWQHKIYIVPRAKQSVRFRGFKQAGKCKCMSYADPELKQYQEEIKKDFYIRNNVPEKPFIAPLAIQVVFAFPISKSDINTKRKKEKYEQNGRWIFMAVSNNDYDNLCKPLNDSMNKTIIQDDGMIAKADIFKIKCDKPFISIKIYELTYKGELF